MPLPCVCLDGAGPSLAASRTTWRITGETRGNGGGRGGEGERGRERDRVCLRFYSREIERVKAQLSAHAVTADDFGCQRRLVHRSCLVKQLCRWTLPSDVASSTGGKLCPCHIPSRASPTLSPLHAMNACFRHLACMILVRPNRSLPSSFRFSFVPTLPSLPVPALSW